MTSNDMTTIRIHNDYRRMLVELASRIALAQGSNCSMTEALDMLLEHCRRHGSIEELAAELLREAPHQRGEGFERVAGNGNREG